MGLPIKSGTGGHFTLLPNPRMARRGVPRERRAERFCRNPQNHEDDGARGNQLQKNVAPAEELTEAAWLPLLREKPAGDGWRDDAEQASDRTEPVMTLPFERIRSSSPFCCP
jgi:hypothetical protein